MTPNEATPEKPVPEVAGTDEPADEPNLEDPQEETAPEIEPWRDAYAAFLRNMASSQQYISRGFVLHDLNRDGIPELVFSSYSGRWWHDFHIYTFAENTAELLVIFSADDISLSNESAYPGIFWEGNFSTPGDGEDGLRADWVEYGYIELIGGQINDTSNVLPEQYARTNSLDLHEITEANIMRIIYGGTTPSTNPDASLLTKTKK